MRCWEAYRPTTPASAEEAPRELDGVGRKDDQTQCAKAVLLFALSNSLLDAGVQALRVCLSVQATARREHINDCVRSGIELVIIIYNT